MKKIFVFAAAALVALASCSKENGPQVEPFGEATTIDILLQDAKATRAEGDAKVGTVDESKVYMLEFYIFNNDGSELDPEVNTEAGYWKIADAAGLNFNPDQDGIYKTTLKVRAGTSKQILVVANANLGAPSTWTPNAGETFADVMEKITVAQMQNSGASRNTRIVPATGLEMSGFELDAVVNAEVSNAVTIKLTRMTSRIETPTFANNMVVELDEYELIELYGDEAENVVTEDIEFEWTGFAVINGLKKTSAGFIGRINQTDDTYTYDSPWDKTASPQTYDLEWIDWEATNTAADGTVTGGADEYARGGEGTSRIRTNAAALVEANNTTPTAWTGAYSGMHETENIWFLDGTEDNNVVYVYESKPGIKASAESNFTGFDPSQAIALIVEGTLSVDGQTDQTRYWRINIRPDDAYHIVRGASYQTSVTKILTPGYSSPQEAEEKEPIINLPGETSVVFTIDILPWVIKEFETQM